MRPSDYENVNIRKHLASREETRGLFLTFVVSLGLEIMDARVKRSRLQERNMRMSSEKNDPRLPATLMICQIVRRLPALLISGGSLAAHG